MSTQPPEMPGTDSAEGFANRAQTVMASAPYLDHPTVLSVAQQSATPTQAQSMAQTVAQAISQTWDGYEQTWADPVLQAKPSITTGLVQYIKDTIGPPPVDAGTISQLQQSLQKDGLGGNLDADGAWTSDWQQQYNQALETYKANQEAGDEPGSVKTSTATHSFLSHLSVTGALDSIAGWARQITGDVGGAVAAIGQQIGTAHLTTSGEKMNQYSADIINALGGHATAQSQKERYSDPLNALNDALAISGVAGLVKGSAEAIGANVARGTLEKEAVTRSPGVIAKTLFNANSNGRLLGSKFIGNLPGLARVTPIVGKLAAEDGFYYTGRTMLAQPYRYAAVRAAGQAFGRTQLAGLGLYADTLAASKLPGNTQATSDMLNNHLFDAINHNIDNYGPRVLGWSPLDVNNLALFLHGPVGMGTEGSTSSAVGQHMQNWLDNFTDTLGAKGVPAAFQQATGLTHDQLLDMAGGDSKFLATWMTSKVSGYAQDWYAQRKLGEEWNGAQADQQAALKTYKAEYRQMPPEQKTQVVSDMLASDPSMTHLTNRVLGDVARAKVDPKAAMRSSLADFKTTYQAFQQLHANGDLHYLMSPQGRALLTEETTKYAIFAGDKPADFATARYMQTLSPLPEGDLGLARNDTLTRSQILRKGGIADQYQQALNQAGDNPATQQAIADQMANFLHDNFNWDARRLGVFGATGNPNRLLQAIRETAADLADDVYPTYDMPATTAARIQALQDAGYKIVVGDHLGDFYTGNLPDVGVNDGWLTRMRTWAGKTGLDPARVPDQEVNRATRQKILDELATTISTHPQVTMGPYQTPSTVLSMLADDEGVDKTLPSYARGIFHATSRLGLNKTEIKLAVQQGTADSEPAARAELEQRMASGIGPRDTSRKAMFQALTTTHSVKTATGSMWEWEAVDKQTANLLMRAVARGYQQPGYIMGWQAVENWARAGHGFPFADRLTQRYAGNNLIQTVANWPNRVAQVRNRLRFTISAQFDMRRWVKQALKMGLEGVEPVGNPLQRLMDEGSVASAQKLYQQLAGSSALNDQMDADRMLAGRSLYGIYSPQWHGAYFANELRKQGKSTQEIKDAFNRVFKYGVQGGTSPLERSINTVFFPFSFEKTLLRNTGAYLLDRPAQALMLDAAVDEWRKADKNATIGAWVEDHYPVLYEMNSLNNAFTHGISPGQLGGINAPIIEGITGTAAATAKVASSKPTQGEKSAVLLNLFLPQNWTGQFNRQTLSKYLPVWSQFAKVWQSATEQAQIGTNALYDTLTGSTNAIRIRPTVTPIAQQEFGTREKVKLVDALQPVLDHNAAQADDADKILWPQSDQVPQTLWGQPVNKTTIGEYVHAMYPAYDQDSGTAYAVSQQQAEANYISHVTAENPSKGQQMAQFAQLANSAIGKINRDEYSPADQAEVQNAFQTFARTQAEADPDWLHLYDAFYAYALGPVKSPNGKAAA